MIGISTWLSRRSFIRLLTIVSLSFLITGCDWDEFAQNSIYPIEDVNKTKVPDVPPRGYENVNLNFDVHTISGEIQNVDTHGWFHHNASNPNGPVLIFFHGNGMNLGSFIDSGILELFEELGCHFVLMDYPGYGRSSGVPSEAAMAATGDFTIGWLRSRVPNSKIFVWGHSLGAAVAMGLASRHQNTLSGWAITSSWTSLGDVAKLHYKSIYGNISDAWKTANRYDVLAQARTMQLPGVIHHGTKDDLIPFSMGVDIYQALANDSTVFVELTDRGHNDIFGDSRTWESIEQLLQQ